MNPRGKFEMPNCSVFLREMVLLLVIMSMEFTDKIIIFGQIWDARGQKLIKRLTKLPVQFFY